MNKLQSTLSVLFIVAVIFACNRSKNLTFEDWDKNNDSLISYEEFEEVFTANFYNDWNQDDDPYLDDEDLYISSFEVWDVDEDDVLSEDEWVVAFDHYFGDYVVSEYNDIDLDDDNAISYDEYYQIVEESGYYLDWNMDKDDYISEEELSEGIFSRWDVNNDLYLDKEEYLAFDDHYLDI